MGGKWLSRSSWLFQHDPRGHSIIKVYLVLKITYLPTCHLFAIYLVIIYLSITNPSIISLPVYHPSISLSSINYLPVNHLCIYASSTKLSICLSVSHLVSMAHLYPLSPTNRPSYVSFSLSSLLGCRGMVSSRVIHTGKCASPYQCKSFWQQPPTSINCPVRHSITLCSPTSTSMESILQHHLGYFLSSVFSNSFSVVLLDDMS